MRKTDTLIVGAGITGLTYANFCNSDYLIVEKDKTVGGLCRTFYEGDYIWDYAGHFFHFRNDYIKSFFEHMIPQENLIKCKKNTKIFYKGLYIDYPFQSNIYELPKQEFIDCLYDLYFRKDKDEYLDFEDMLYCRFGKSITLKFLKPYNEKLYACSLCSLDPDAMGRFFPYTNITDVMKNMKSTSDNTYNGTFQYPRLGAETFVKALKAKLKPENMLLNAKLTNVDINNHIAVVNGEKIKYKKLVNTIPLNTFLSIIEDNTEAVEKGLHSNKVLVFNLGFDELSDLRGIHWIYFPEKTFNYYRVGFYSEILNQKKLSLYVEIGFNTNENINVEKELEKTLEGLKKCGIIKTQRLLKYNYVVMNPGYVHVTSESEKLVKLYKDRLKEADIYTIGRYGGWKYCSIEDCMIEAIELSNDIK